MNTNMKFTITGQRIELTEPVMLVAGTVHIYTAAFVFDSAWDGYTKTAVFRSGDVEREQLLTDDACTVPWEVLLPGAYLKVGVYGTMDGSRLPTIWTERTQYINSGAGPTEEAAKPSPTLVEQLTAKVGNLDALKTEDKSSVVAAINEVWDSGGGGTGGGTTDHSKLINRDKADQHPMSAIAGLVEALDGKQPAGDYLTQETDPTVPAWAKEAQKPSYTASEVGADPSGTAASQVAAHNTGTDTHSDIRLLISGLTDRINALADSDDTTLDQLSEIVAYIKSNRTLIEAITTSKVSVSDIIDNLTTNASNKPLSAAQGVALKALIDAITVPEALPNPNALTFIGAVTGSYDGSNPLTVEIPSGGGSGGDSGWEYLGEFTNDAQPTFEIGKYNLFFVSGYATVEATNSSAYLRPSIDGTRHFPWTIAFNNASKKFFGLFTPYFSIAYVTNGSGYAISTDRGNATVSICESDDLSKGTAYITLSGGGASSATLTDYKMKIYGKP